MLRYGNTVVVKYNLSTIQIVYTFKCALESFCLFVNFKLFQLFSPETQDILVQARKTRI